MSIKLSHEQRHLKVKVSTITLIWFFKRKKNALSVSKYFPVLGISNRKGKKINDMWVVILGNHIFTLEYLYMDETKFVWEIYK